MNTNGTVILNSEKKQKRNSGSDDNTTEDQCSPNQPCSHLFLEGFPHLFFSLGIARNGPEIQTAYLVFIYMKAQENFGLTEETRQEI